MKQWYLSITTWIRLKQQKHILLKEWHKFRLKLNGDN